MNDKKKPALLKRRGVSEGTLNKVASQVRSAENAQKNKYQIKEIKLSDIELWDSQPRKVHLTISDIIKGDVGKKDENRSAKLEELKKIVDLANSTKELTMLVMPLAYALPGGKVRLIDGQRRTMAAIYSCLWLVEDNERKGEVGRLNEVSMTLKVYPKKPSALILEKIGMASNALREEISLENKLAWVIRHADDAEEAGEPLTGHGLAQVLGMKKSQSFEWMSIIRSRKDPWVAKTIAKTEQKTAKFNQLIKVAKAEKSERRSVFDKLFNSPVPDNTKQIKIGNCNAKAIKSLLIKTSSAKTKKEIKALDLDSPTDLKKAFQIFLDNWEAEGE